MEIKICTQGNTEKNTKDFYKDTECKEAICTRG